MKTSLAAGGILVIALATFAVPASAAWWTSRASDETPPVTCSSSLVSGMWCSGSYCDGMFLLCDGSSRATGFRRWLGFVSEESGSAVCNEHEYVTGLDCNNSYCDNISIECTGISGGANGCQWSPWFSEEQGGWYPPAGTYVHGVRCSGSYCDNVSVQFCRP